MKKKMIPKSLKSRFELRLEQSFRRMWFIAILAGVASLGPLIALEDHTALVLVTAVSVATVVGLGFEIRGDITERRRAKRLATAIIDQGRAAQSDFTICYISEGSRDTLVGSIKSSEDFEHDREKQLREATSSNDYVAIGRRELAAVG